MQHREIKVRKMFLLSLWMYPTPHNSEQIIIFVSYQQVWYSVLNRVHIWMKLILTICLFVCSFFFFFFFWGGGVGDHSLYYRVRLYGLPSTHSTPFYIQYVYPPFEKQQIKNANCENDKNYPCFESKSSWTFLWQCPYMLLIWIQNCMLRSCRSWQDTPTTHQYHLP